MKNVARIFLWCFSISVAMGLIYGQLYIMEFIELKIKYYDYGPATPKTDARQDLEVIRMAIDLHDAQNKPLTGSSLEPLLGRYLQEIPTDPWGGEYLLNTDVGFILCFGADGKPGGSGADEDIYFRYKSELPTIRVEEK